MCGRMVFLVLVGLCLGLLVLLCVFWGIFCVFRLLCFGGCLGSLGLGVVFCRY